jgi:hypothetical protein
MLYLGYANTEQLLINLKFKFNWVSYKSGHSSLKTNVILILILIQSMFLYMLVCVCTIDVVNLALRKRNIQRKKIGVRNSYKL